MAMSVQKILRKVTSQFLIHVILEKKAAEKLFSDLGRISKYKENKIKSGNSMKIIVTGCVAQAEGEEIKKKRNKSVDLIFGPQNYQNITEALKKNEKKI